MCVVSKTGWKKISETWLHGFLPPDKSPGPLGRSWTKIRTPMGSCWCGFSPKAPLSFVCLFEVQIWVDMMRKNEGSRHLQYVVGFGFACRHRPKGRVGESGEASV